MADLQYHLAYKTRGNASPQGKPRVYFCCHPDDFALYFPEISDEILAKQSCAVWYAQPADAERNEDFLNDLAQMQLFVIPVTSNLLYTKNHVIDAELPFALKHHIPVLPLMQESDLEAVFNQACGNLQFLDKNARDMTAIPYEEKLQAFLSSVLIGDELTERIRAAFDAYIFLSYRKKDRKYARELMHLIHKNKFCRDIAIWYDEFLTPGENFNDAIRHALEKSDLFVITVTPNLISEPNYVMSIEYPMARDAGKHIIPAEMVQTDRDALLEKFANIPLPTDARDRAALSQSLLAKVQALAIRENDTSPEHNFFIGLAYLGGIDVEVDHARAVELITSSAETGLPEAIAKLIHMYENGEGVARDYRAAVAWREKKIEFAMRAYQSAPDKESLDTLFWDVIACADAYSLLGNSALALEKLQYAKELTEADVLPPDSQAALYCRAVCCDRLGALYHACGDFKTAKPYLEQLLALSEQMLRAYPSTQARRALVVACRKIGIPGYAGANAALYRERAIAVAEELVRETGSVSARELLLEAYQFHGVMLKVSGAKNLPAAKSCYEKSLAIAQALYDETGTLQARRNLAAAYGLCASMSKTQKDMDAAWQYHEQELSLREAVLEQTEAMQDARSLAAAYSAVALSYASAEKHKIALFYYKKALSIRKRVAAQTENEQYTLELCRSCNALCDCYATVGDWEHARTYAEKELDVLESMAQASETAETYDRLADAYYRTAMRFADKKASYLSSAHQLYGMLCAQYPDKAYYKQRFDAIGALLGSQ